MARNYNRNNTQWENTAPVNRDGEMTLGRFLNRFTGNMETGGQRILPNSEQLVDNAIGLGEGALALGSSVALEPFAGLYGLSGLVNGNVDNAVNNIDKVRALGYQPKSKVLVEKLRNIEPTANAAMRFVDDAAVGVENWTRIPREIVKAVPIMGAELFSGLGVLKSANRFLNPDNLNASSVPSNFGQSGAIAGLTKAQNKNSRPDKTEQNKTEHIPAQTGSQSTQRPNTAGSYPKILKRVEAKVGKAIGRVLDYGAGLGLGSDAMRRAGYNVDSFEPQPSNWKGIRQPTFIDNKGIKGQYDTIMLMNVLNVLEPELRDIVLDDVIDKIAEGGQAVIGARKFKNDIENTKSGTETNEAKAFKLENGAYQKGWDGNELLEYVQSRLPEGYSAVKINAGANGVLIKRK